MNENLNNCMKIVEDVLRKSEKARNDSHYLYVEVLRKIDAGQVNNNFLLTFLNAKMSKKNPVMETVTRCKRKLCEKFPELKGTEETEKARKERQINMFEYFRK